MIVEVFAFHVIDTKGNALSVFVSLLFSLSLYFSNLSCPPAFALEAKYRVFSAKKKQLPTKRKLI
jgi:hypothetical protein